jgi:hypothetical protein
MALIEINRNPSRRELNWFGALFALFAALVGCLLWWRSGALHIAAGIWIVAAIIVPVYYLVPRWRKPIYLAWMYATYPIGWIISHLVLAITYYLVFTSVGLLMRLFGRDPMERRFNRNATTYWIERDPVCNTDRYFRQF